jgi:hypothetical protein
VIKIVVVVKFYDKGRMVLTYGENSLINVSIRAARRANHVAELQNAKNYCLYYFYYCKYILKHYIRRQDVGAVFNDGG